MLLEGQLHLAQVALGFHQHQRGFGKHHCRRTFAWDVDRPAFGFDCGLNGCDLSGVGVHPLQARTLRHLRQLVDGQLEALHLRQATGRRRFDAGFSARGLLFARSLRRARCRFVARRLLLADRGGLHFFAAGRVHRAAGVAVAILAGEAGCVALADRRLRR